jgi:hypothetical protein
LYARDMKISGLRICEACRVIFETRTKRPAVCSSDCRRTMPRHKVYPAALGGWHTSVRLDPPWHHYADGKPGQRRGVTCVGRCVSWGEEFISSTTSQKLCLNCGGGSGRVRRQRGGSARGRQLFRFRPREGKAVSVGVRLGNGHQSNLSTTDGVIETADAEIARQLDENSALERIT